MSRVLIVVPESGSYFYRLTFSDRIEQALREQGWHTTVCTLPTYTKGNYDYALFINVAEMIYHYHQGIDYPLSIVEKIIKDIPKSAAVLAENVRTDHYRKFSETMRRTPIEHIIDIGFHTQKRYLPREARFLRYTYVFNGLVQQEAQHLKNLLQNTSAWKPRKYTWSIVGAYARSRVEVVKKLTQVNSNCFVFLPTTVPIDTKGVHLDEKQLQHILDNSDAYIWSTHHQHFYVESERFRQSLLSGCLPIKVVFGELPTGLEYPFGHQIISIHDIDEIQFDSIQQKLEKLYGEYLSLPSLGASLVEAFEVL